MTQTVVIAGAGSLGLEFAQMCAGSAAEVLALRRSAKPDTNFCRFIAADLISGTGLEKLPKQVDLLIYCPSPDRRNTEAYENIFIGGVDRLRDQLAARRSIFVSSTAVYGEDEGKWVDEDCAENPVLFNGEALLRAEQNFLQDPCALVVRLSGLVKSRNGRVLTKACGPEHGSRRWTNRIHLQDAARALQHIANLKSCHAHYCVSDNEPVQEFQLLDEIRKYRGLAQLGPDADSRFSGKRVSNRRLRETGWEPKFPDFRSIYC